MVQNSKRKEKLLHATIYIIQNHGVQHATARKIAEVANTSLGAINYYYGVKHNLIDAAMDILTNQTKVETIFRLISECRRKGMVGRYNCFNLKEKQRD